MELTTWRTHVHIKVAVSIGFLVSVSGLPVLDVNGINYGFSGAASIAKAADLPEETPRAFVMEFVEKLVGRGSGNARNDVEELFVEQRLDHFDRQETRTFSQRYFVNKKYWAGAASGAPVFLCVGGEGPPLASDVLSESVHCNDMIELAPAHEALLLAVEHRYYGKSNPGDDWATESLKWLSSQQALADLAAFHGYISETEGLGGGEKWVTWGGSYPGMLAGWARLKYPHLFHAAVSSSSPLLAQLDFPQYAEVMRDSLADGEDDVGGSEECASAVEKGHRVIGDLLDTAEGRQSLVKMFNLCDSMALEDDAARVHFAGDGVVVLPIQENDPACEGGVCNIKGVCKIMTDRSRGCEVQRLAALRDIQRSFLEKNSRNEHGCEVFPPLKLERHLRSTRPHSFRASTSYVTGSRLSLVKDSSDPNRAWLYQTCTEFGFYQTCEIGTRCPFTQGLHTLDLDLKLCQDAFGISPEQVGDQVRLTNLFYGGDEPRGSRVIFPNGEIDPWHALGVLRTPMPGLPAIYVQGASHHFWTHPSKPTDSPDVVQARQIIWNQITAWLQEDDEVGRA